MINQDIAPISVTPPEWEIIKKILSNHAQGCEIWAYGSRVMGRPRQFSDLDLLVTSKATDNNPNHTEIICRKLRDDFTASNLPWRVDVVDVNDISPEFQHKISAHSVLIYPA